MGEAKRRGSREQRVDQATAAAVEAQLRADMDARALQRMREANERQRRATIAALPAEVRWRASERERATGLRSKTMLAAVLGLALTLAPPIRDGRRRG
jgi:uncharacterized protein involved in type VI secretion and phage assembly